MLSRSALAKEKELKKAQQRFIINASHELRTPLTLLKGSCDEVLNHKEKTISSQMKWFDTMIFGISEWKV